MDRFGDCSVVYHEEERDGLVKICRLAMYQKYPKYPTEGFEALYSRPPVIYVSAAAKPGVSNYLCLQVRGNSLVTMHFDTCFFFRHICSFLYQYTIVFNETPSSILLLISIYA